MATPVDVVVARLRALGVVPAGAAVEVRELSGGVSSDVRRVIWDGGAVVVKAALARLRVEADWQAPLERSETEVRWLRRAKEIVGAAVPDVLADVAAEHAFAMEDLGDAPTWKSELAAGHCDTGFAAEVGTLVARIHAATAAAAAATAAEFDTEELFRALRVEPYIEAAARSRPEVSRILAAIAADLLATRHALVHGDMSPKNVLAADRGPVFVDAETAWWGDPAFDVAFATTHLLLKALWHPEHAGGYAACRQAFGAAYERGVDWEPPATVDMRTARLVPALLLARVDGKSPVEYLDETARAVTRRFAVATLLAGSPHSTDELAHRWYDEVRGSDR